MKCARCEERLPPRQPGRPGAPRKYCDKCSDWVLRDRRAKYEQAQREKKQSEKQRPLTAEEEIELAWYTR